MTREGFFEVGKRAVFIKPMNGHNMGKIVELVRRFEEMDRAPPGSWIPYEDKTWWFKQPDAVRVWIVESMGDPLLFYKNGEISHMMVGPVPESYLAPLDDFEVDESLWIADAAPTPKEKQEQVTHEDHASESAV
jgi:hypothetical protein